MNSNYDYRLIDRVAGQNKSKQSCILNILIDAFNGSLALRDFVPLCLIIFCVRSAVKLGYRNAAAYAPPNDSVSSEFQNLRSKEPARASQDIFYSTLCGLGGLHKSFIGGTTW